jgi:hypothetical protein
VVGGESAGKDGGTRNSIALVSSDIAPHASVQETIAIAASKVAPRDCCATLAIDPVCDGDHAIRSPDMHWIGFGYTSARRTGYDFRDRIGPMTSRSSTRKIVTHDVQST